MCRKLYSLTRRASRLRLIVCLAFVAFFSNAGLATTSPSPRPALILQLGNPFNATVWSFAAHAPLMAAGIRNGIQLWDTRTWELQRTILVSRDDPSQSPSALDVSLSPDGKLLAAVTTNGSIALWESASGIQCRIIHHTSTEHLLFTADGKEIVGSGQGSFRDRPGGETTFWNVQTGKQRLRLPRGGDFALSSDGRRAAVVASANTMSAFKVTLWDAHTGRPLGTLADGSGVLGPLDFSPNGKQIVTVGEDPQWVPPSGGPFSQSAYAHNLTLKIWDVATQKLLHIMPGQSNQIRQGLRWSADGKDIVSISWGILVYTSAGKQKNLNTDMGRAAMVSADGETVIADGEAGVTSLDLRTGIRRAYHHDFLEAAYVNSATYSQDGSMLATGEVNSVRLWNGNSGRAGQLLPFKYLSKVFFLPDERSLVTAGEQRIQVWDSAKGVAQHTFTNGLPEKVDMMSPDYIKIMSGIYLLLSPDGKTLLRKSGDPLTRNAEVLDAKTGQLRATLMGMEQPLNTAVISLDGTMLADINSDGVGQINPNPPSITVWNLNSGRLTYSFPVTAPTPGPYAFSSDSKTLAVSDYKVQEKDGRPAGIFSRIVLHNMVDGQMRLTIDMGQNQNTIRALLFSPDNRLLAVSYVGKVKFYEMMTGKLVGMLTLPQENLLALAFSPDGTRLITEGEDFGGANENLMNVWRVRDGHLLATLLGLNVNDHNTEDWLAFTPEGYYSSSPSAQKAIRFRVGDHLLSADRYPELNRPDLIQKAMQGQ